jgi:hypothetical protein
MRLDGDLDENIELYVELLRICGKHSLDPSSSVEMEGFMKQLLSEFPGKIGDFAELTPWLSIQLENNFTFSSYLPRWIQGADWQFYNNRLMVFAGQIDLFGEENRFGYHADTSIYVFIAPHVEPVTIIQQF